MSIALMQKIIEEQDLEKYLTLYKDKLILLGRGHHNYATKEGYYEAVLIYKNNRSNVYRETLYNKTPNQCALKGLLKLTEQINKPIDVVLLCGTALGFKKCRRGSGVNCKLCLQVLENLEKAGVNNVTDLIVLNSSNNRVLNDLLASESNTGRNVKEKDNRISVDVTLSLDMYEELLCEAQKKDITLEEMIINSIGEGMKKQIRLY